MVLILVCDSLTGIGKTSSVIRYMKEHPDQHYIYIAPLLACGDEVCAACPELNFVRPKTKYADMGEDNTRLTISSTKNEDFILALSQGRNICSTHQLFTSLNDVAIEHILAGDYTLFVDEALDVVRVERVKTAALKILTELGCASLDEDGKIVPNRARVKELGYDLLDTPMKTLWTMINNYAIHMDNSAAKYVSTSVCILDEERLKAFKEVIVTTYMFEAQDFAYYCKNHDIPYSYIGIGKDEKGFHFTDNPEECYIPEYTTQLTDRIHLCRDERLNRIGDEPTSLSMSWYSKADSKIFKKMNCVLQTYLTTRDLPMMEHGNCARSRRYFTVYKPYADKIGCRSMSSKNWLSFTARGVNSLRDRDIVCFLINPYINPSKRRFLAPAQLYDEDAYSLSILIQFLWRSAIRDGKDIYLYLPSARMRRLLEDWMAEIETGRHVQKLIDITNRKDDPPEP